MMMMTNLQVEQRSEGQQGRVTDNNEELVGSKVEHLVDRYRFTL
jgi:hypothetical protein